MKGSGSWPSMCAGRDMAARAHLRPVSGCDSCVRCCGPEKVPNSAAAARSGQSGMCNRDEDVSSIFIEDPESHNCLAVTITLVVAH